MSRAEEQIRPWHQRNWDARAAANFIGGGSGSALLIAAAVLHAAGVPYRPVAAGALALIALGLACVWLEIGRPWRALNVFFHPQTSWMTREAIVAVPLFASGAAALWLGGGVFAWLAAALAAAFLYCQARILAASKGIPAWRDPRIVPLIAITGLAEGAGLALLGLSALGNPPPLRWIALAVAALLAARAVAWRAYRRGLAAPRQALAALDAATPVFDRLSNWVGAPLAVAATVVPSAVLAGWLALIAAAFAVGGGWGFKYVLVTRAAFNQGFAIPTLPVRGRGKPAPGAKPGW
jgi:phenylacetyl-CoA:acceptor oxidoreductase subunit 2